MCYAPWSYQPALPGLADPNEHSQNWTEHTATKKTTVQ